MKPSVPDSSSVHSDEECYEEADHGSTPLRGPVPGALTPRNQHYEAYKPMTVGKIWQFSGELKVSGDVCSVFSSEGGGRGKFVQSGKTVENLNVKIVELGEGEVVGNGGIP